MKRQVLTCISLLLAISVFFPGGALAAPIQGEVFNFRQPDGSKVQVRVWGDEFYQRVESIDGYTLVRDAKGWICYAKLLADESEFVPTDAIFGGKGLDKHPKAKKLKETSGFKKKLKLKSSSRRTKSKETRKKLGYDKLIGISGASGSTAGIAEGVNIETEPISSAPLLGSVIGLTICVDFPDEAGTITTAEVDSYCNQTGYTGFGNNGSIYDYFYDVSGGNLQYTNIVVGYYTAQNNKGYYDDPTRDAGDAGRELLGEALDWLENQGFDFTQLSVNADNEMLAINLFYAGQVSSGWSMGLWPHSGYYSDFTSSSGVSSGSYQITDMDSALEIRTFCHENGHMISKWPDLYDYGYESRGVGNYCLMAYGASNNNPVPPNAYYRDLKGWDTVTEIVDFSTTYSVQSNSNVSFKYLNLGNIFESFYIESRIRTGRNASLPDEGLVIWHIDEAGNNDNEQMTPELHYMVSLEQADGAFDLESNNNAGDSTDLFDAGYNDTFDDTTSPNAKWWDGSDSGLLVHRISEVGSIMYFGADLTPPTPDPAEWEIEPAATGVQTIAMEAKTATDDSGVEYYFECVTDSNFHSGWQDSVIYDVNGLAEGTTYTFRVRARDKSDNQNETGGSIEKSATTDTGTDTSPPFPAPSRWKTKPRKIRLSPTPKIGMIAKTATDETDTVGYYFDCVSTTDTLILDPNIFDSSWQSSSTYVREDSNLTQGDTYAFRVKTRDGWGNETGWSTTEYVALVTGPRVLTVPEPYAKIQSAINAAVNGDIVEVSPFPTAPYTYRGNGNRDIDFLGKAITVRSTDPEDPAVVAATVIDVEGTANPNEPHRAFIFQNGEGANSILAGFTIKNGYIKGTRGIDADVPLIGPGGDGTDGGDAFGGAIVCIVDPFTGFGSSPTIRNCVIINSIAEGGDGGDGADGADGEPYDPGSGDPSDPNDPNDPYIPPTDPNGGDGGHGGDSGAAHGGGIYCDAASSPIIDNCTISDSSAIGGIAGNGGDGGDGDPGDPSAEPPIPGGSGGDGDDGGWAIDVFGGGIYCAPGSNAIISNCTITNDSAISVNFGAGGTGGTGFPPGTSGANGWRGYTYAGGGGVYHGLSTGAANISDTIISGNEADGDGGGVYLAWSNATAATLTNCEIKNNFTDIYDNGSSRGDGAGIFYDHGGTLTLNNCDVSQNIASGAGGGICAGAIWEPSGATVNISGSTISGNVALYGGGIYLDEIILTIGDSEISDNIADEGGGVNGFNCTADINNCTVSGNSAAGLSGLGAGFAYWNSSGTIENTVFTGNDADGAGGALFFDGWSIHEITNCLISDNTAYSDGAGVSCNIGAAVIITNSTLVGNSVSSYYGAGGGVSCAEYGAYVGIENSILWANSVANSAYGAQIAVGRPLGSDPCGPFADVEVSYSDVQGGEAAVFLEDPAYTAVWWLAGNKDEDPLFATTSITEQNYNYYLSQTTAGQLEPNSPCVNAGDPYSTLNTTYLTTRTDHVADTGTVDMGYHYDTEVAAMQHWLSIEVVYDGYGTYGRLQAVGEGGEPFDILDPNTRSVRQGTVVELYADPNTNYRVRKWTGTDDNASTEPSNTVTMDSDRTVTVEFEPDGLFKLITSVIGNGTLSYVNSSNETVTHPGRTLHWPNEVITLIATPDNPSDVVIWSGTDDDYSTSLTNTITMTEHKEVSIEFYAPQTIHVAGDWTNIQLAIDEASDRDIIIIQAGTYSYEPNQHPNGDILRINGKAITLTSTSPDDPCVVAATVIQGRIVMSDVGRNTVINGLTIQNPALVQRFMAAPPSGPGNDGIPGTSLKGGGMELVGSASPTVRNCVFDGCYVWGAHGSNGNAGIDDRGSPGNGGWAGYAYGGAVYIGQDASPIFEGVSFIDNWARGGDGGNGGNQPGGHGGNWDSLDIDGSSWIWDYGPFEEYWKYSGYGGAVYCDVNSSPEFVDCEFTNNRTYGGSCGISGTPTPSTWPRNHYKIDSFGGAIYAAAGSSPEFTNCEFTGNEADIAGPSSHARDDATPISYDPFISYGGAVAFEDDASPTFEGCIFNGNLATEGGAMWWNWSDPIIADGNFVNNSAFHGGAVLFVGGTTKITRSIFRENEATMVGAQGGAICSLGANAQITNCDISNNSAVSSGGGIYISSKGVDGNDINSGDSVLLKNCLITNNLAGNDGGGISANWHSDPNIINCTIADNTVTAGYGGGLYCSYGNYTNIIDGILWGNFAGAGQQIAIGVSSNPSRVDVSYSDVQGSAAGVFIDTDCTLQWDGTSNINADPNFITGPLSGYYLSQIDANEPNYIQTVDSPCVDVGSDLASHREMNRYTTRTDSDFDKGIVDMGYHHLLPPIVESCRVCDLVFDGIINFGDFATLSLKWLGEGCSADNDWCQGADLTFDTDVDFRDLLFFTECWLVEDTTAPIPNPSQWEIEPYSTSTEPPYSISMTAKTAVDAWSGGVQYYFECVSDSNFDSGWQSSPAYDMSGLDANTEYGYRVKARDGIGNETEPSIISYTIMGEDDTPPSPDPMTWETAPYATSPNSIAMVATTATDPSGGIEYYFEDANNPAYNSGWRNDPSWQDTGLTPETTYTYRVKARDALGNETGWSTSLSATTLAEGVVDTTPPTPDPSQWEIEPYEIDGGGGTFDYYASMIAAAATDDNYSVEYYFECTTNSAYSSGWQTDRTYIVAVGTSGQGQSFRVKTRDTSPNYNQTGWSSTVAAY